MSLSQRSRTALFLGLTELIADEEAVEEMLSHFPSRDLDEPVTKEFLRAEISDLRAEISGLRAEMHAMGGDLRAETSSLRSEMHEMGGDLRAETSSLRSEMHEMGGDLRAETSSLRSEMHEMGGDVRAEISGLRAEMHQGFQRLTLALVGSMISLAAVVVTATAVLP
jgi:hypothetical protein